MNTACRLIALSCRPSMIRNWPAHAVNTFGGARKSRKGVVRFPDGSAVCFTSAGLPVEYVGA